MKEIRIITLVALLSGFILLLRAQENRFNGGIEAGPGVTLLYGNQILKAWNRPDAGCAAGLSFQYNFEKIVSIRTGIDYQHEGSAVKINYNNPFGPSTPLTGHNILNYLVVPVFARVSFVKKIRFFMNVGPYLGILLKATEETDPANGFPKSKSDYTKNLKRVDVGLSVGPGIAVPIKENFEISFEARNNVGLLNISTRTVYGNGSIKTFATNFLFGFEYKFGAREKPKVLPAIEI
jgi:hypothetical protein